MSKDTTKYLNITVSFFCFIVLLIVLPKWALGKSTPLQIAAGYNHTVALRSDGTLWSWGGDYTGTDSHYPSPIGNDNDWVSVTAGYNHTVVLKSDGTLWAWGRNVAGQLGDGTTTGRFFPVPVVHIAGRPESIHEGWVSVSAGGAHTVALKSNGQLYAWGSNTYGQLGNRTTTSENTPYWILMWDSGGISDRSLKWVSIVAGGRHTVGLQSDGTLWAWGENRFGQLGYSSTERCGTNSYPCSTSPKQIGTDNNWVAVAAGEEHTLALKSDGTLWGWGHDGYGQLGLGDDATTSYYWPFQIGSDNTWIAIAAGGDHTVALKSDGTLWGWGFNFYGCVGDGTRTTRNVPTKIGTDNTWVSIAAGYYHTIALRSDLVMSAWGFDFYGQVGDGPDDQSDKLSPKHIWSIGYREWTLASAGSYHTVGMNSGYLYTWGRNYSGQLGDGTTTQRNTPGWIGYFKHRVAISAGGYHTLALKSDGTLSSWGRNEYGQLGYSTERCGSYPCSTFPQQIGTNNDWASISAGGVHSMGLKSEGTLWAWGQNYSGQLGDGTTTDRPSPVQVGADNDWVSVSTGGNHTMALKADGTLWAWGSNTYGQLGDGTQGYGSTSPQQIGSDTDWVTVSAGGGHTLALKVDGTLWAWGYNEVGQLGDGTTTNRYSPTQIGDGTMWVVVSAGGGHTLALQSDGTLWAWGQNYFGQLGYKSEENCESSCSTPVQVGTDNDWVSVSAGGNHTMALKAYGTLWVWGMNNNGQLGDGTMTDGHVPIKIWNQDDVVIDFGQHGIWTLYNGTDWEKLHSLSPEIVTIGDMDDNGKDEIIIDFGDPHGIWVRYNDESWKKLHSLSAEIMVIGDLDDGGKDDVIIDFGDPYGIWVYYNDSSWEKLHNLSPEIIITGDIMVEGQVNNVSIIDFGPSSGIWMRYKSYFYGNYKWVKLHSLSPEIMASGDIDGDKRDEEFIIDFGTPHGIWVLYISVTLDPMYWEERLVISWEKLHNLSPEIIVTGDMDDSGSDDVIIDFGTSRGTWVLYDNTTWEKLHPLSPERIAVADLDGTDDRDEVIIDFGSSYGIWEFTWGYKNPSYGWQKLHGLACEGIALGQMDGY